MLAATPIQQQKARLRLLLRNRLQHFLAPPKNGHSGQQKEAEQRSLCANLSRALRQQGPQILLAFAPRRDEVDIWCVLQEFWQQGPERLLAFAKVCGNRLQFIRYPCAPQFTAPGEFWQYNSSLSILEPAEQLHSNTDDVLSLLELQRLPCRGGIVLLCPGLGFARRSGVQAAPILRLGRGGGFYDRAISELAELSVRRGGWPFVAWGLGFSVQWCPELAESWDEERDQTLARAFLGGEML